jgi:uncharacterized protein YggE
MTFNLNEKNKKDLVGLVSIFLIIVSVYFVFKSISEFVNFRTMQKQVMNTVTISGYGEVKAVPDIATVSFTIRKEAKTVKEAQEQVAVIEQKVLGFLKLSGIEDKDIKTENVGFYPKYEYQQVKCPTIPVGAGAAGITVSKTSPYYCPPGRSVITGYEASESISVKIRKIEDVGKIVQGIGELEVSDLNGPNFAIDDEDALKAQARKEAIDEARSKAKILARDLRVRLGDVVSFSEDGNYPMPMYASKEYGMGMDVSVESAPAQLPAGENIISSNVSITFQIK